MSPKHPDLTEGRAGIHEVTDDYNHSGWNLKQGLVIGGVVAATILAILTPKCSEIDTNNDISLQKPSQPERVPEKQ
jgi:hypothetical protein